MNQINDDSVIEAGLTRTVSMASKYSSEMNAKPVKIAIIVDNSHTMANSQENLARNLSSLFSEISKYDADVTVLSTSWREYYDSKSVVTPISSTKERHVVKSDFKLGLAPVWSISKDSSEDVRNAKYLEIGQRVRQMGTNGSDEETPLLTLTFAIHGMPQFFTDDSRLLVYIISDEDDSSQGLFISKYYEAIVTDGQLVPVTRYFANYSYQKFNVITKESRPVYQDGVVVGYEDYDSYKLVATEAICRSKHSPPDSVCAIETATNVRTEASPNYCEVMPKTLGYLFSKCEMTSETKDQVQTVTDVIKDDPLFFFTRDQNNSGTFPANTTAGKKARRGFLHAGLSQLLNEKFKENYLIAAQVNLPNQGCSLAAGQSYSTKLQEFSTFLPEGQFLISSICDATATSGSGLKKISERLETIISKTYRLIKAQNEVILAVRVVKGSDKVTLTSQQYKFEAGKIILLDASLIEFDRLEVDLKSI